MWSEQYLAAETAAAALMARARLIRPGLYIDEMLATLPFEARLLYAGLPMLADRDGRLEDRPARIRAVLYPYDSAIDADALLTGLARTGHIVRYQTDGRRYIAIPTFSVEQSPHVREPQSVIPPPSQHDNSTVPALCEHQTSTMQAPDPHVPSTSDPDPDPDPESTASASPSVLDFVARSGRTWHLTQSHLDDLVAAHPAIDVIAEMRKARLWLLDHPERRKTPAGMRRYLSGWLTRASTTPAEAPAIAASGRHVPGVEETLRMIDDMQATPKLDPAVAAQVMAAGKANMARRA